MSGFVNPFEHGGEAGVPSPIASMGARNSAMLIVYTPRAYDTQVLRPFVYNFTETAVNKLLGSADSMTQALGRADVVNSQPVAESITPDPNGTAVDMNSFNQLWTFMLVIKSPNTYQGKPVENLGYKTTIMTGHCLEEPVAMFTMGSSTPTFNMNCHLCVHSRQVLNAGMQSIDAYGARNTTNVMCSDDVIDPSLQMAAPGSDLFLITPYTVLQHYDYNGTDASAVNTCGAVAVSNLQRSPVQTSMKTPGVHMKQILQGLDAQNREAQSSEYAPKGLSSFGVMTGAEDTDAYKNGVVNKYSELTIGGCIQFDGLDVGSIFTIGDVVRAHPDAILQPQRVSQVAQRGIMPQTVMSPKVQFSSMIQSSVPALANDVGLSSIAFMYTTYDPQKRTDLKKSTFQVVPQITFLSAPPVDPGLRDFTLKGAVQMFEQLFEANVVPYIKSLVGDFEVSCKFQNNGECEVNLQLLNFSNNVNGGADAWTETPMRLGTLSMTSLGSERVFTNNALSLSKMLLMTQGKTQWNPATASFPLQTPGVPSGGLPQTPSPEGAPVEVPNYAGMAF